MSACTAHRHLSDINSYAGVQLPVFVTSVWAIRRMSASGWPGLADGGALWFRDLTMCALDMSHMTAPMGRCGPMPHLHGCGATGEGVHCI